MSDDGTGEEMPRETARRPTVIVIMGVSGAGKTTVGQRLASVLGWRFHDADDYHLPSHVQQMRAGHALTDEDRAPWLATLAALIGRHVADGEPMVLACSALRRAYRVALMADVSDPAAVRLVHLHAQPELIAARLAQRAAHFFPPLLLDTQLETLEPPGLPAEAESHADDPVALILDASDSVDELVAEIVVAFGLEGL